MKRVLVLSLLIICIASAVSAQKKAHASKPGMKLNPDAGYIMINEFTGGLGLGATDVPYAKGFFGFTTIHGWQVNKSFVVAGGAGVSFYNEGTLVPLFFDLRYRVYVSQWTPYVFGDGGFMLDFSEAKDTRLFLNPGIGVSYTLSRNFAVNLGAGLLTQFGSTERDSFFNLKTGLTYKF